MKTVIILPDAEDDILGIWHYSLSTWGLEQAVKYDEDIQHRIESLAHGQSVSRSAEDVAAGLRRTIVGQHVVFFREDAEWVTVVRVLHQRMDVGRVWDFG